jgi:DNA polymerase-3 subunit beta
MAVHDIRYYLNGILFIAEGRTLTLVATDGNRLALAQSQLQEEVGSKQEVILPRKTVLELQRLLRDEETPIEMRFASNQARFSFSGMDFVTKLVEGKFPDFNRVIPRQNKNVLVLGRGALLASLQRAAILTSEKFKGVRVNLEPGLLSIAASNAEQEEAKEEIEVDYSGPALDIGFNVTYLIDVLANMQAEMVKFEFQDSSASVLVSMPDVAGFKYVVMPMRI